MSRGEGDEWRRQPYSSSRGDNGAQHPHNREFRYSRQQEHHPNPPRRQPSPVDLQIRRNRERSRSRGHNYAREDPRILRRERDERQPTAYTSNAPLGRYEQCSNERQSSAYVSNAPTGRYELCKSKVEYARAPPRHSHELGGERRNDYDNSRQPAYRDPHPSQRAASRRSRSPGTRPDPHASSTSANTTAPQRHQHKQADFFPTPKPSFEQIMLNKSISRCKTADELRPLCWDKAAIMDHVSIANAFYLLSKYIKSSSSFSHPANIRPSNNKRGAGGTGAGVGGSAAGSSEEDVRLVEAMERRAVTVHEHFQPRHMSNILWAIASIKGHISADFRHAISRLAVRRAELFKPREVATLLWAFATAGDRPEQELLDAMARRAVDMSREFKPQDVGEVMWAFATLGMRPPAALAAAMLARAESAAGEFKPQDMSNTLWGIAKTGALSLVAAAAPSTRYVV